MTKHDINNIPLASSEVAQLWATYMSDSLSQCVNSYFKKIVKDPDIASIMDQISIIINRNLNGIKEIFNSVNHAIPQGFTDEDVNVNAKPLYDDSFTLEYVKYAVKFAMMSYSNALSVSIRPDVRKFFSECIYSDIDIMNRTDDVLLEKGMYIKSPVIPTAQRVEFVQNQDFLSGIIGEKRPLNALEISHLHDNIRTNRVGLALITGFAQTTRNQKVKEFMVAGRNIAMKHIDIFEKILKESDVNTPSAWDLKAEESTEPPFSEKFMMFHISALISFSMGAYGLAMSNCMRSDLGITFARLIAELGDYAKKGASIMIENAWLEKIPEAVNRKELINV